MSTTEVFNGYIFNGWIYILCHILKSAKTKVKYLKRYAYVNIKQI